MSADIDIDVADRDRVLELITHVPARQSINGNAKKHISGIYVTDMPYDPVLGCLAIDYDVWQRRFQEYPADCAYVRELLSRAAW